VEVKMRDPVPYKPAKADETLGKIFQTAEYELNTVALKYGFSLRLVDDSRGTWIFYPQVDEVTSWR
jgi:hypothetical protein